MYAQETGLGSYDLTLYESGLAAGEWTATKGTMDLAGIRFEEDFYRRWVAINQFTRGTYPYYATEQVPGHSPEETAAALAELPDYLDATLSLSFARDLSMEEFAGLAGRYPDLRFQWVGVRINDGERRQLLPLAGFDAAGLSMLGAEEDEERYPFLWLPLHREDSDLGKVYTGHFLALLGYQAERAVLVAPGGLDQEGEDISGLTVAAAVAGALAGESDPAVPLGGAELLGLYGLEGRYGEKDLDRLILGGVTPVEQVGGTVSVVRGVTTRTATGAAADPTWRDLATIRVVDDVIPSLRQALAAKFRRAKNTPQSRGAIRAQVVLELEQKLSREIITGYEDVAVSADPEEPTRCLVDFSFTVAHGLNQIWLTAHITV